MNQEHIDLSNEIQHFLTGALRIAAYSGMNQRRAASLAHEYLGALVYTRKIEEYEFVCDDTTNPPSVVESNRIGAFVTFLFPGQEKHNQARMSLEVGGDADPKASVSLLGVLNVRKPVLEVVAPPVWSALEIRVPVFEVFLGTEKEILDLPNPARKLSYFLCNDGNVNYHDDKTTLRNWINEVWRTCLVAEEEAPGTGRVSGYRTSALLVTEISSVRGLDKESKDRLYLYGYNSIERTRGQLFLMGQRFLGQDVLSFVQHRFLYQKIVKRIMNSPGLEWTVPSGVIESRMDSIASRTLQERFKAMGMNDSMVLVYSEPNTPSVFRMEVTTSVASMSAYSSSPPLSNRRMVFFWFITDAGIQLVRTEKDHLLSGLYDALYPGVEY